MKKILIILLVIAIVIAATCFLWQYVPLIGISSEDMILRREYDDYVKAPLMEGLEFPQALYLIKSSSGISFPVELQILDETGKIDRDIQITIRAEDGSWHHSVLKKEYIDVLLGSTAVVTNGQQVRWKDEIHDVEAQRIVSTFDFIDSDKDVTFLDMVIRKNGHIIGYLVGRFQVGYSREYGKSSLIYYEVLDAASFPMVGDEYQAIREECIEFRIQMMKEENRYPNRLYLDTLKE